MTSKINEKHTFAQLLHEMRIRLDWTQEQMADALSMTQGSISRIERGIYLPDAASLLRVLRMANTYKDLKPLADQILALY